MSIDMDNSIIDGSENNDNVDLGLSEKNESITNDDSSKFNNTTIFQAICSPYYFKQNEWIKMPKSIFCINQNSDGRNFITLNASATGRILLNEYICPDSVIKQSSKNDNVIQIKTKSRGLFSIRFSKYDTAAFNTLLNFSKDLIRDSIVWTYENKDELFLIEKSPSLDETYGLVIKNNIDDSTDSFKVYCEKTTKYEIIDQLYVKEGNNWISLGLSKINIVIPNYIMENNIENSENPEEMEFLSQNSIEPIITAHSLTDIKKPGSTQSSIMCFLRAPINQDCIILKNKNIHDDNVYELNFMFDEKIYEYMIYSKKTDNSLAFVSEYINKLSNFYSKIEEEKYDPELFANSDILAENTEESISEGQNSPIDNVSNKDEEEEEEVKNDDEINTDASSTSQSSVSNKNSENNLLAGFTFMTTSDKPPLADQNTQDSQNSPIKNQFVFDLGDFSSNNNTVESEKNKNSTSIFSGFTLSTPTKENTSTKDEANDNLSSPLFANKPKFVVPTLNTNSFGFAFNTSSTQKDTTTPTTNSLFGNSTTTPTTNSLFGNSTTTPTTNSLFGNSTTTPTTNSLFGNSTITPTTNSLFGNSTITPTTNSLFGNSTTTPTANPLFGNKTTTATDTKPGLFGNTTNTLTFGNVGSFGFNFSSSKNQTNTQNSDSVTNENTSNAEKNNVEVTEVVEKKEVEEVAEVVEKDGEEKETEIIEKNNNQEEIVENETNDSEKKEIEKSNFKDEISEIKKQNHEKYNYPEVDTSLSGTLFDVSEPYNEVTNEGKLSKLNDNNFVDDIMDMKNGKLSSFNYNHFVRSCNDLFIGANNIEVPIREFSINMNTSTKDIMKDSIANLKFEINKIRSIFNDSDASIITYYDENSQKSNESLNAKTNIKKTKSITELEMKTIMNDYIVKKTETEENKILSVQRYIDKYKSSINNLNEKVSNEEPKAIITEECENKSSRVADIVSNINNIINNNNQPVIKKENHISQNYVDKMTKEFTMKGIIFKIYICILFIYNKFYILIKIFLSIYKTQNYRIK